MAAPGIQPGNYNFYIYKVVANGEDPSTYVVELRALVDQASWNASGFKVPMAFNITNAALTAAKVANLNPLYPNNLGLGTN